VTSEWQNELDAVKRHLFNPDRAGAKTAILAILERALRRADRADPGALEQALEQQHETVLALWRSKCEQQATRIAELETEVARLTRALTPGWSDPG
jgi:hypothetical protein